MYTKSKIQQEIERHQYNDMVINQISNILEKFDVQDVVYGFNINGVKEEKNGYFIKEMECKDLNELARMIDFSKNSVRILENKKFIIGTIYSNFSDLPLNESLALDLEFYENISL